MSREDDVYELTVGDVNRGARATCGMDIATISRELRISPATLMKIEAGVFSGSRPQHMMHNVVSDYARFLALDPDEIRALNWKGVEERSNGSIAAKPPYPLPKDDDRSILQCLLTRLGLWRGE
jgi:cytoskeletal protein RodZ